MIEELAGTERELPEPPDHGLRIQPNELPAMLRSIPLERTRWHLIVGAYHEGGHALAMHLLGCGRSR